MAEVARLHAVGGGKVAVLVELLRFGLLVNAVDVGLLAAFEVACDQFVGQQHQLLDELVGDVILDEFELGRPALLVQPDLDLRHLEIESAGGEAFLPEGRGAVPRGMDAAAHFILWRSLEEGECLPVGQAGGAADHGAPEADIADRAVAVDLGKDAEGEAILVGPQAAETVGEILGKHRDDAVGEVDGVASRACLLVERGVGLHVVGDVGDVDGRFPAVIGGLHLDGVVEVASCVGIDRDDVTPP